MEKWGEADNLWADQVYMCTDILRSLTPAKKSIQTQPLTCTKSMQAYSISKHRVQYPKERVIKNAPDEFACVHELNKLAIWAKIWIHILIILHLYHIPHCCMTAMTIKEFNELNHYITMFVNFSLSWHVMHWWYNNVLSIYLNPDLLWVSSVNGFSCCLQTYNIRHSMSEPVLFRMERSAAGK